MEIRIVVSLPLICERSSDGKPITGKKALIITIELAQELGKLASSMLKGPHDLEYEKTIDAVGFII